MPIKDMLFSFEGRIRRRDWWVWSIAVGIGWSVVYIAIGAVIFGPAWAGSQYGQATAAPTGWTFAFGFVAFLPSLWVQTALAAKRTHDRNNPMALAVGLTVLSGLATFVPEFAYLTFASALTGPQADTLYLSAQLGAGIVNLGLLIVLGFFDGTKGPNRYGRSPKGIGGDGPDEAAEVFS